MRPLPKIPTPPARAWRQFRVTLLPHVVFVLMLGAAVGLWLYRVPPDFPVQTRADPVRSPNDRPHSDVPGPDRLATMGKPVAVIPTNGCDVLRPQ